jgi:hypothetical protein
MPLQQILPTWFAINACNDISPSGLNDNRTKAPLFAGGLNVGDYFDLTEQEAREHSFETTGILHAGRYRRVKVHEQANAVELAKGHLGFMPTVAVPDLNTVTSLGHGVAHGRIVVMLNTIDPGNYGFIQELGIASVHVVGTVAIGGPVSVGLLGTAIPGTTAEIGRGLQAHTGSGTTLVLLDLPVVQG